jgi:hypothetical protein
MSRKINAEIETEHGAKPRTGTGSLATRTPNLGLRKSLVSGSQPDPAGCGRTTRAAET